MTLRDFSILSPFDQTLYKAEKIIERQRMTLSIHPDFFKTREVYRRDIENLESTRDSGSIPKWWLDWLALNRLKSENTD